MRWPRRLPKGAVAAVPDVTWTRHPNCPCSVLPIIGFGLAWRGPELPFMEFDESHLYISSPRRDGKLDLYDQAQEYVSRDQFKARIALERRAARRFLDQLLNDWCRDLGLDPAAARQAPHSESSGAPVLHTPDQIRAFRYHLNQWASDFAIVTKVTE